MNLPIAKLATKICRKMLPKNDVEETMKETMTRGTAMGEMKITLADANVSTNHRIAKLDMTTIKIYSETIPKNDAEARVKETRTHGKIVGMKTILAYVSASMNHLTVT